MSETGHIDFSRVRTSGDYAPSTRRKQYVEVVTLTSPEGSVTPLEVVWTDGRHFVIDKVLGCQQAHSSRTGGTGLRYTVRVGGHETYLYYEAFRGKWFVEAKRAG